MPKSEQLDVMVAKRAECFFELTLSRSRLSQQLRAPFARRREFLGCFTRDRGARERFFEAAKPFADRAGRAQIRHQWTDGRRGTLEHQLPKFFEELSGRVKADNAWRAKVEERRRRSEEESRLRFERQRLAEIERSLVDRLRGEISVWQLADDARRYVSALRERRSTSSPEDSAQLEEWCAWIERWIAANDPTTKSALIPRAGITNE